MNSRCLREFVTKMGLAVTKGLEGPRGGIEFILSEWFACAATWFGHHNLPKELISPLVRPALANTGSAAESVLATLFAVHELLGEATDEGTLRSTGAALVVFQLGNCERDLE